MKEMICIVCPQGCRLSVDEENNFAVSGNACKRGEAYAKEEMQNPTRHISSTVVIKNAALERLPVKTDKPIAKADIFKAMALLDNICVNAPVKRGDIIVENILGSGANFVATRSFEYEKRD